MNNQSPLVPQGSLLEQKNKGRARVKIAVFFVLTIHGVALLALLMQGCQKEKETAKTDQSTPAAPTFDSTNAPVPEVIGAVPPTNPPSIPESAPIPAAPAAVSEYTVVQGDTFSTIAKKFKVSTPAVIAANPGAEPTKLHVGQKLHIPPAPPVVASSSGPTPAAVPTLAPGNPAGGEQLYTVKSGDNLTKIGGQFGVSPKAIRSANSLKTDSIRVGQKLKIPGKVSGTAANETASTTAVVSR
jgi:LysM repeat protein